jgi:hypothetical protein
MMSAAARTAVLVAALLGAAPAPVVHAQGRPAGDGRIWIELGLGSSRQAGRCQNCIPDASIGGPSLSAAGGVTLGRGFGVALLGREFQELTFDGASFKSSYVVALAQYAPDRVPLLSVNGGAGWARHSSVSADGSGAVLYAGTALRLPPRSRFAVVVTADVVQSIHGSPSPHLRLLSVGLAIGAATSPLHRP